MTVIGVTGHRVLADVDGVHRALDGAVRELADRCPEPWTVVSALAEGADRMVARRLLARPGTHLVVVLPLDREDYLTDFATEQSRAEFDELLGLAAEVVHVGPQPRRDDAYAAGGRAVLDRADLIVAVWDGEGAQGQGGTGDVVQEARRRGLPLVWIHAGNRKQGTLQPTSLGRDQGTVSYERLAERIIPR